MKIRALVMLILLCTLFVGCNGSTSIEPTFGEAFKIKNGETLTFENEKLELTFEELLEDSRCPEGATCVWAGNARIMLRVNDLETELNTYLDPKITDLSEYTVELISLNPYPKINDRINIQDYTAELMVLEK